MSRTVGTCCILTLLLSGCGWNDSLGKLQPISGKVSYNGKPVKRATIIFAPVASGMLASGEVVDGRYRSVSVGPDRDGLLPGPYLVGLYYDENTPPPPPRPAPTPPRAALAGPGTKAVYTPLPDQGQGPPGGMAQPARQVLTTDGHAIPEKFLDVMKSGLEVKVVPGIYGFDFELRD